MKRSTADAASLCITGRRQRELVTYEVELVLLPESVISKYHTTDDGLMTSSDTEITFIYYRLYIQDVQYIVSDRSKPRLVGRLRL